MLNNIISGFLDVFRGRYIILKHLCFLGLSIFLYWVHITTENFKTLPQTQLLSSNTVITLIIIFLLSIALSFYFGGYLLSFIHKSYNVNSIDKMPELNFNHFSVFIGAIPLYCLWGLYYFLFSLLLSVVAIPLIMAFPFINFVLVIIMFLWALFFPFVYIAYAENFSTSGLFNILVIFKFVRQTFKEVINLALIFILMLLLTLGIPMFILWALKILFNISFIFDITFYYIAIIINLVWHYCLVRIYKEKILQETEQA